MPSKGTQHSGDLPQIGITRLPSFVKNGMVTASNNSTLRARLNINPRPLAKMNAVKLNQQFEEVRSRHHRSLNEHLTLKIHSADPLPDQEVFKSTGSLSADHRIPTEKNLQPLSPRFRPAYDPTRVERSRTFFWPKSNPLANTHDMEMEAGTWKDSIRIPQRPAALPPVKFNANEGPVFQTGPRADWPSRWFTVTSDTVLSPRRENTLGRIKIWKPTLDSILKSEAVKQTIIERAKTSLYMKEVIKMPREKKE